MHDDPNDYCKKRPGNLPLLLIVGESQKLLLGKSIVCKDLPSLQEGLISLIGIFYLLDIVYPLVHKHGLTVMQYICFGDKKIPGDILTLFDIAIQNFNAYKNS